MKFDCVNVKLKNRRVMVGIDSEYDYYIRYKNYIGKREIRVTEFMLSKEAMLATVEAFLLLKNKGVINEKI